MSVHDILTGINREDARVHRPCGQPFPSWNGSSNASSNACGAAGGCSHRCRDERPSGVTDASGCPRPTACRTSGDRADRRRRRGRRAVEHAEDDTEGRGATWRPRPHRRHADRHRGVGNHALCRRRTAHGAPSRTADRLGHLQPRVARSGRSGVCPRKPSWGPEVRDRIDAHEGRNGPEIDQHALHGRDDPPGGASRGNRMVNMQLTNDKLVARGTPVTKRRDSPKPKPGSRCCAGAR